MVEIFIADNCMILNDEILLIYILRGTMNLLIVVKIQRPEIIVWSTKIRKFNVSTLIHC